MAIQPDLVGMITLTSGSTAFTWSGTSLVAAAIRPGDEIRLPGKAMVLTIATVTSATEGTLTDNCPAAAAGSGQAARVRYQSDLSRVAAQTRQLIELLSGKGFFKYDAAGSLAERDDYDTRPQGFAYLNIDTDPMELYVKASDANGDWAGPVSYATGPTGPAPNMAVGTTDTGAAGTDADVTIDGTNPNYTLNFTIPRGDTGAQGPLGPAGFRVSAVGELADRTTYDAEDAGFSFVATDGDGVSITEPVVFVKLSSGSADWSDAVPFGASAIGSMAESVYDADGIGMDVFGGGLRLPARSAIAATSVAAGVDYIQTAGYATPGDGGAALYTRVVSEPSHPGKVQSADGTWWELVEREVVKPEQFGAIATDDAYGGQTASDANTTANTLAFQAMLDYCAAPGATIFLPGRYYVGALAPSSPIVMRGRDWKSSGIFFDSASAETWLDFSANNINQDGSAFEDFMLVATLGRDSSTEQKGIVLRKTGSNRNTVFRRLWIEDFSLSGIEASDTFNCAFEDMRFRRCGQPGIRGRGLLLNNITFSSSTATTGNKIKNVYASGCRYGIEADGSLSYQQLEQVFCESCTVGVYAPSSQYATLIGCYFEANVVAGAQLQSGGVIQSRFSIGGTDDVTFSSRYFRLTDLIVEIGRGSTVLFKADNNESAQAITEFLAAKVKMKPTSGSHSPEIRAGTGSPEGAVVGSPGDLWLRNASFAPIYHKRSGTATNTGWAAMQPVIANTTASRPSLTAADAGYVYHDTTLGKWIGWSGSAWLNIDGSSL